MIEAVLFDFGGVVTASPFEAFERYEEANGLPAGLIRRLNSTNPDDNAWAKLERSEVDLEGFGRLFEAEASDLGYAVDAAAVLDCLSGALRPEMVTALARISASDRFKIAVLTNNLVSDPRADTGPGAPRMTALEEMLGYFDVVVESSKVGVRKPEPRFYEIACERLGVEPAACVFLDDLGVNLKPARAMGMTTIKVTDPAAALTELAAVIDLPLA